MPKGIPNPKPTVDEDAELAAMIAAEEADKAKASRDLGEANQVLKDQAKALSLVIDPSWDTDTLAGKVLDAQEAAAEAAKAAFEAARKVPVFLLRDAWPVADERHDAGETVNVTQEIADKWYDAGVARPGKKLD